MDEIRAWAAAPRGTAYRAADWAKIIMVIRRWEVVLLLTAYRDKRLDETT